MPLVKLTRFFLPLLIVITGCGTAGRIAAPALPASSTPLHGAIHGGQQPITGATINIYAVGTTGDGSASTSVLDAPLTTDANGFFDLTNKITCPTPTSLLYLVATGGNPGLPPPANNFQSSLIVALGQCGNPSNVQFINVNEVTTVAAIYALAPFMNGLTSIGSSTTDATALADAFTLAWEYANITSGTSPGVSIPDDVTVPTAEINSLANLLSACVNSTGGVSGDSSFCGQLFALLPSTGGTPPTDTAMALLNLTLNPTLNTAALYNLILPTAPFQPSLTQPPTDFSIHPTSPGGLTVSSTSLNFPPTPVGGSSTLTVTVTNNSNHTYTVTNVMFIGANPSDFTSTSTGTINCLHNILVPYTACDFQVTFSPTAVGSRSAFITFVNSFTAGSNYLYVPIRGTGTAPTTFVTPTSLFLTPYTPPQQVNLANGSTSPLTISSIGFTGIGYYPGLYTATNNCGTVLPAGSSCTINLSVSAGPWEASGPTSLTIIDNGSPSVQTTNLTYDTSGNYFQISIPDSYTFPDTPVGGVGAGSFNVSDGSVQYGSAYFLLNSAHNTFTLGRIGPDGNNSCGWRDSFGSCTVPVYFFPPSVGTFTDTIYVPNVGTIVLFGKGVANGTSDHVSPSSLSFPDSSSAFPSPPQIVTITNTGTTNPLHINGYTLNGANPGDFLVTNNCTTDLPVGGGSCTMSVVFKPTDLGARSASLAIISNALSTPDTVTLNGTWQ